MHAKGSPSPLIWRMAAVAVGRSVRAAFQSVNLWQAFFQRQAVHHMSRFSIPYTLRHFFPSPRTFLLWAIGEKLMGLYDIISFNDITNSSIDAAETGAGSMDQRKQTTKRFR